MRNKLIKLTIHLFSLGVIAFLSIMLFHKIEIASIGEHPGFFKQWLQDKSGGTGIIPSGLRSQWAAWDKRNVVSRSSSIIDTFFQLTPNKTGGRTRAIWADPRNENIILAGAISGGVWRSTNGGQNWKPVNDQETSLMPSCFTHNPFNPNTVYYGTGEGRANSADVDGAGVFKSTNGGISFSQIPNTDRISGFNIIWDIKHSLTDSSTLFVATHSNGLHRSTNGGSSWEKVFPSTGNAIPQINHIVVLPNNRVIITANGNGIWVSDSLGKRGTFNVVPVPTPPPGGTFGRINIANCAKHPNVVYALYESPVFSNAPVRFYKSSNGGKTWILRTTPTDIGPSYTNYCLMLGVSVTDSNRIMAGGVSLMSTVNGGATWNARQVGHSDHHVLFSLQNSNNCLIGNDGGVFRYSWSNFALTDLNLGYHTTQFYAGHYGINNFSSIGGTQDNGTHHSFGPLQTIKTYGADGAYAFIGQQDGSVAYFSTQNQGIRRTDDFDPNKIVSFSQGISAPEFETDGVNFINCYTMNEADQYLLFYRTNKGVYRSNDGGESWTFVYNRTGIRSLESSADLNPVLYVGGLGTLVKIRNAKTSVPGQGNEITFQSKLPPAFTGSTLSNITIHPNNKNTIFVALGTISNLSRIWKISNTDSVNPVFTSLAGNLPLQLPVNSVAVDPSDPDKNLFAATDFGLYISTDSGKTWTKDMRIPNVAIFQAKMRKDGNLFLFTHGRGIYNIRIKMLGSASNKNLVKESGFKVFPNPANQKISIVSSQNKTIRSVSIFSISGSKVYSGMSNSISISSLQPGTYFVQILTHSGETTTTKFVKGN